MSEDAPVSCRPIERHASAPIASGVTLMLTCETDGDNSRNVANGSDGCSRIDPKLGSSVELAAGACAEVLQPSCCGAASKRGTLTGRSVASGNSDISWGPLAPAANN